MKKLVAGMVMVMVMVMLNGSSIAGANHGNVDWTSNGGNSSGNGIVGLVNV